VTLFRNRFLKQIHKHKVFTGCAQLSCVTAQDAFAVLLRAHYNRTQSSSFQQQQQQHYNRSCVVIQFSVEGRIDCGDGRIKMIQSTLHIVKPKAAGGSGGTWRIMFTFYPPPH
jgi:hypothetical protein